jgi:YidC/Oxa1 family membrane protein insertase
MFTTILVEPLANLLIIFYRILGSNMGLAIMGFTIFLRFSMMPLTKPYMQSVKKMKDVAPQLEKLKKKYDKDKVGFAKAQADFYREKGIKPGAGCLPYLLQLVILIAFFNVFTRAFTDSAAVTSNFNELLYAPLQFQNGQVVSTQFLYLDLTKPDTFKFGDVGFSFPGPLVILAALFQYFSVKVTQPLLKSEKSIAKKTKESTDDIQVAMQKSMIYMFPLMTLVIGTQFPSGLALYWLMFSVFQLYEQIRSQNGKFDLKSLLKVS